MRFLRPHRTARILTAARHPPYRRHGRPPAPTAGNRIARGRQGAGPRPSTRLSHAGAGASPRPRPTAPCRPKCWDRSPRDGLDPLHPADLAASTVGPCGPGPRRSKLRAGSPRPRPGPWPGAGRIATARAPRASTASPPRARSEAAPGGPAPRRRRGAGAQRMPPVFPKNARASSRPTPAEAAAAMVAITTPTRTARRRTRPAIPATGIPTSAAGCLGPRSSGTAPRPPTGESAAFKGFLSPADAGCDALAHTAEPSTVAFGLPWSTQTKLALWRCDVYKWLLGRHLGLLRSLTASSRPGPRPWRLRVRRAFCFENHQVFRRPTRCMSEPWPS
jgi:hypothetical protein